MVVAGETPQVNVDSGSPPLPRNQYTLTLDGETLRVDSPLTGEHQRRNLALAIATAAELRKRFNIPTAAIEQGIRNTSWPGRLEFFPSGILLDVAHNPAGAWTLRAALAQLDQTKPRTLIFSCLRDKDLREMAQILFPLFDKHSGDPDRAHDHIVLAPIANPRAASVDDLLAVAHSLEVPAHAAPHVPAAIAQARTVTPPGGLIVVTGSVYLIGEVRTLLTTEHGCHSAQ
jgi:dihydrofolate synthase/folylpolyglutamate synthase